MQTGGDRTAVVIEDDSDVRNLVCAILHEAGFVCIPAATGVAGIDAVREHQPILTTLDISLPGIDGFEVTRRIRSFSNTYLIMLSARDEEIDTLMGLDAGADNYLTKPFRPRELRARIEAMLRRYQTSSAEPAVTDAEDPPAAAAAAPWVEDSGWISHHGLRINPVMWLCDLDGGPVELTRTEFDLLLALMEGNRRVITKDFFVTGLAPRADAGISDKGRSGHHRPVPPAHRDPGSTGRRRLPTTHRPCRSVLADPDLDNGEQRPRTTRMSRRGSTRRSSERGLPTSWCRSATSKRPRVALQRQHQPNA